MSAPDVRNILRVGGHLSSGGTWLGLSHTIECRVTQRVKQILAEEWGQQPAGVVYCGETWLIAAALRTFDADALGKLFPGASGGGVSWNVLSGTRPGTRREPSPITFVPRVSSHPSITFPAAVGLPDASAKFTLSLDSELSFGMVFLAMPDDSGDVYEVG